MKKVLYNTIGTISLCLGILGTFLPLLPSTCFILLATWAFSKSSPTFHSWLYYKSPFAESIQNWQQHRLITTKVKWIAFTSITISYGVTVSLVTNLYILSGLGIGLLVLLAYLFSKPSELLEDNNKNVTYSKSPELHQPII